MSADRAGRGVHAAVRTAGVCPRGRTGAENGRDAGHLQPGGGRGGGVLERLGQAAGASEPSVGTSTRQACRMGRNTGCLSSQPTRRTSTPSARPSSPVLFSCVDAGTTRAPSGGPATSTPRSRARTTRARTATGSRCARRRASRAPPAVGPVHAWVRACRVRRTPAPAAPTAHRAPLVTHITDRPNVQTPITPSATRVIRAEGAASSAASASTRTPG